MSAFNFSKPVVGFLCIALSLWLARLANRQLTEMYPKLLSLWRLLAGALLFFVTAIAYGHLAWSYLF
jgi:hypothetical protein